MKTLDRYIVRSFLTTALMCFVVMMSLRIVTDLFVNIDEFAEARIGTFGVRTIHVGEYYGYQSLVYLVELGGIIIVASAAFTLAMMNHTNELTAMLAAGVSLHRVVLPIVICAMAMGGLIILDQELVIPAFASRLCLDRDEAPEANQFPVRLVADGAGAVWYASSYHTGRNVMDRPVVVIRDPKLGFRALAAGSEARPYKLKGQNGWLISGAQLERTGRDESVWRHTPTSKSIWSSVTPLDLLNQAQRTYYRQSGQWILLDKIARAGEIKLFDEQYGLEIKAESFVPDPPAEGSLKDQLWSGRLERPTFTFADADGQTLGVFLAASAQGRTEGDRAARWDLTDGQMFCPSDMTSEDLILRQSGKWLDYMSTSDIGKLIRLQRVPDRQAAELVRHVRFTAPLNNLVMLLLGLPFILSRERNIRASASLCLLMVGAFYVLTFICQYGGAPPMVAAWLPIFVFGPAAIIMLDAVKT